MSEQGKNWCFTVNNHTLDEQSEFEVSHECISYIVYGEEVGESGTPHLQGYIEFSKNMRVPGIKKLFNNQRMHLEKRIGTAAQASQYCKKEGKFYERGVLSITHKQKVPVTKNKLLPFREMIRNDGLATFSNDADCNLHLLKHGQMWLSLNESPRKRSDPLSVFWFWGPTGSGKTRRAFDMAEARGLEPFIKSGSYKWFDGYEGHKFVIFDDFRDAQCEFGWLLRLLDIYPLRIEIKGGTRQWKADTIIVTCPMPPEECYRTMQSTDRFDKIGQLIRRITKVEHITAYEPTAVEAPQPPKGGEKRKNEICEDWSPASFNYLLPVRRFSGLPPLPRSPLTLEGFQSPPEALSPTQEWVHPPEND